MANFINLQEGLFITNVNTSVTLFSSAVGDQDFNASFLPGEIIQISDAFVTSCTTSERPILRLILLFTALLIMLSPIIFLFVRGELSFENVDIKFLITAFIIIMVGLAMLTGVASNLSSFCDLG